MTHIRINMSTPELDVCPTCKHLIYKREGAWLDVWLSGTYFADTETPHAHQPSPLQFDTSP